MKMIVNCDWKDSERHTFERFISMTGQSGKVQLRASVSLLGPGCV